MATIVSNRTEQFFFLTALHTFLITLQGEFDCVVTLCGVSNALTELPHEKIRDPYCLALVYKSRSLVSLRVVMTKHHRLHLADTVSFKSALGEIISSNSQIIQPEENIPRARTVLSPRFLYYQSPIERRMLCEGKLKVKIAHFRLPSAPQKGACVGSQMFSRCLDIRSYVA